MGRLLLAVVCLVTVSSSLCLGGTIYIRPDGTGDVPTIGAGFQAAGVGDTLLLASGTFTGAGNHDLTVPTPYFTIRSETGNPDDCVIDCQGVSGVHTTGFYFQTCSTVIEGITFTNATGAGLNLSGSDGPVIVRNCAFIGNGDPYWSDAGAIHIDTHDGGVVITDCEFVSNEASIGGGAVYIYGVWLEVTIDRCFFSGNQGMWGGAIYCYMHEAMAHICNSVFYGNSAGVGGGIAVMNMSTDITGCTFVANSADTGSGIATYIWGTHISNCIIAYGTGGCGFYFGDEENPYPWIGCTNSYGNEGGDWVEACVPSGTGTDSNFSADPGFCNWEVEPYDLRLCSDSPCLPGNHPNGYSCGLIGALGAGACECGPTAAEPATWGAIKAMYR